MCSSLTGALEVDDGRCSNLLGGNEESSMGGLRWGLCQWRVKPAGPGWVILTAGGSLMLWVASHAWLPGVD